MGPVKKTKQLFRNCRQRLLKAALWVYGQGPDGD